jgi:hypothetical protein
LKNLNKGGGNMKCPLRLRLQKRPLGEAAFGVPEQVEDFDLCIEENCAWWDEKNKGCIMKHIISIDEKLEILKEKI